MKKNVYANKKTLVLSPYGKYFAITGACVTVLTLFSKLVYDFTNSSIPINFEEVRSTHKSRIRRQD